MKLLGNKTRKKAAEESVSALATPHLFDGLSLRLTKELDRSIHLAAMLAKSRALDSISVADFLAAMYLNHWDALERYWDESEEIEKYLVSLCHVSPQRWHKWLLEYEADRRDGERQRRGKFALRRSRREMDAPRNELGLSRELESVLGRAGRITPGRERRGSTTIPILTSECILLAMARDDNSEVGRRLVSTGLDLQKLERAAKDPKRAPIH